MFIKFSSWTWFCAQITKLYTVLIILELKYISWFVEAIYDFTFLKLLLLCEMQKAHSSWLYKHPKFSWLNYIRDSLLIHLLVRIFLLLMHLQTIFFKNTSNQVCKQNLLRGNNNEILQFSARDANCTKQRQALLIKPHIKLISLSIAQLMMGACRNPKVICVRS